MARKNCYNCNSNAWKFISEDQFGDTYECELCGQREGRVKLNDGTGDWIFMKYHKNFEMSGYV